MLNRYELDELELIDYKEYPSLDKSGHQDDSGFQIFTPGCIVNDILELIGLDYITDINKKILEPSSGDGAFTVRILEHRLKKIYSNKPNCYLKDSLIALSTIYSIEMDQALLIKQRNNIYTILKLVARENNINIPIQYDKTAKTIIKENFVWGESNTDRQLNQIYESKGGVIGWYMPTKIKTTITVPKRKTIKITNLLGDEEEVLVEVDKAEEKEGDKCLKTFSNRIRFNTWNITDELLCTKEV